MNIDLNELLDEFEDPMGIDADAKTLKEMSDWAKQYLVMKYGGDHASDMLEEMTINSLVDLWMLAHTHKFPESTKPTFLC
jgi:hypothetical protein